MYGNNWPFNAPNMGAQYTPVPVFEIDDPVDYAAEKIGAAVSRLRRAAVAGIGSWHRRWLINRTEAALSQLDDRILHDIGVERSNIAVVARRVVEIPGVDPRRAAK